MFKTLIRARGAVAIAGGVVIATVTAGSAAATDSTPPDSDDEVVIEVTDEGDEPNRVVLASVPAVGASALATTEAHIEVDMTETGRPLDTPTSDPVSTEPREVAYTAVATYARSITVDTARPEGGYVATVITDEFEQRVDEVAGTEADSDYLLAVPDLEPLIGVETEQTVAADGHIESTQAAEGTTLSEEQQDALDEVETLNLTRVVVPETAVGEGATWTLLSAAGGQFPLEIDFELEWLDDDEFEIAISIDFDLAELSDMPPVDGVDVGAFFEGWSGTLTGTGEYTGSVSDPLAYSSHLVLAMDLHMVNPFVDYEATGTSTLEFSETSTPA